MKFLITASLLFAFIIPLASAQPQASAPKPEINEASRLHQEYINRRAEWVMLRRQTLEQEKHTDDAQARLQLRVKLAQDEKPLLAKMSEAGKAYQAAMKKSRPEIKAGK